MVRGGGNRGFWGLSLCIWERWWWLLGLLLGRGGGVIVNGAGEFLGLGVGYFERVGFRAIRGSWGDWILGKESRLKVSLGG